ncbi:MAG: hypothetical protein OEL55_00470 [Desulfobulbaceae bacterium]|nr:hypothetical protein [Desulfobulbaceae bacterium]
MKINDLLYGPQGINKNNSAGKSEASSGGVDFQKLLEEQLKGATSGSPVQESAPMLPLADVPSALRVEGVSLSESAIEDLELFGSALENKEFSATDLAPYVDSMEEKLSGMLSLREQLPPGDQLGILIDRVATATYLETAKYRRGDYSA